ncbi:unnamed protein product [Cyprideis torosa]|uniref:Uncharacterized protein n=1 Tax=Cyprideis torosa TaxID=163714 RepID=A0A7R8ZXF3_9CRUS|nr:unnamed protein product [Cyprideis torosa]CAG0906709.1 unnamed protein product [Cyprideis torosa]
MMSAAMSNLKRVTLELGGKSPLVVFADADLDEAVETCHNAIFANQGQNCVAGSRTFVEAKIYAQFVAKATAMAASRKVGPPAAPDTQTGPLITQAQMDKVLDYIDSGKKQGARLQTGGKRVEGLKPGFFVEPTVFSDVKDDMKIAREEIFGPVQSIIKFNNMEEVIGRANATTYGLGAGIITKDIDKALTFAQAVQAGSVFVNCYDIVCSQTPFGGFKMSGQGRELGEAALHEYCEIKTITIKLPEKNS